MTSSATVTTLASDAQFAELLAGTKAGAAAQQSLLLFFTAEWHGPSQQMTAVVAELAREHAAAGITFVAIEAETFPDVTEKYPVTAVPAFVLVRDAAVVDSLEGANAPKLTDMMRKHAATITGAADKSVPAAAPAAAAAAAAPPMSAEELNARLTKLVSAAPVMLFMKGDPNEPKCGFSRKMVALLREQDVKFGYFDILTDDAVRQGLKTFSDWPTFPQLYAKGKLLGGLDVLKELVADDELKALLPEGSSKSELEARLKQLTTQQRMMLFMKGDVTAPQCGFSRTAVALLAEAGFESKFGTFDILTDNDVRQGLKAYSDWPTYPQLYHDGVLVGGLDVMKELHEDGELATLDVTAK